jgi:hypothetical protein
VGTSTRTPWIGETGRRGGIAIAKTRWSSDFVKDEWGFICESSAITSAGTSGKAGGFRIWGEQRRRFAKALRLPRQGRRGKPTACTTKAICESSAITSAGTSGKVGEHFRIREEQRELQGPKSKSGGTEIAMSPKTKFTKWECPDDGWKVWEAPDTTLLGGRRAKRIGTWRAVHTRVHPRCIRSPVGHVGRMVPLTIWPIRDQQSGFDDGWKA